MSHEVMDGGSRLRLSDLHRRLRNAFTTRICRKGGVRRTAGARWSNSGGRGGLGGGVGRKRGGAQRAAGIHGVVSADRSGKNGRGGERLRLCLHPRGLFCLILLARFGDDYSIRTERRKPRRREDGERWFRSLVLCSGRRPSERLSLVNWKAELRPCRRVAGSGGNQGGRRRSYLLKKKKRIHLRKTTHTVKEPHDMEQITRHTHKERR